MGRGRVVKVTLGLGLLLLALAAPIAGLLNWATEPGPRPGSRVALEFTGAESADQTAERLAKHGLVSSPRLFAIYLAVFARTVKAQAGPHYLRTGLTPREIARRIGRLPSRAVARVTLPEGYSHLQIASRLEQKDICAAVELTRAVRDRSLLLELGLRGKTAEGYLFPTTYEFFLNSDPKQAVRQMVQETRRRLARLDAQLGHPLSELLARRGWGEHEVLTLASIIEKEARAPEERPLVASVFYNRLDDPDFRPRRTLQSDATAAYGCILEPERAPSCAGYRGRVTPGMVRDPKNRYNTYRFPGLPDGPIANPGEGAIEAALVPARTDYLYFVADGSGRHRFSRTFEEHRRAVTGQ